MPAVMMPKLSDSMEEGTIVRWLIAEGANVSRGEELVEIETDKATIAYEAEAEGVLTIGVPEGSSARVGATIGHIGEVPADIGEVPADAPPAVVAVNGRAKASPLARRLARALGVELGSVTGTGPGGRIVRRDIEDAAPATSVALPAVAATTAEPAAAAATAEPGVASHPAPPVPPGPRRESEFVPLTNVQATIARRMAEAKSTIPEFTLTADVDMEAAVAMRAQFAELAGETRPPSLGDFVIRACALSLRAHPNVNAGYRDGGIERHARVNIGVAVASPGALFVPTVFDADGKSLGQIAAEVRELAQLGRTGQLTPPQVGGATFTVSNLGMYGLTHFTAVLNPPQAAILAVGTVEQRVVAHAGAPAVRHRMTITLTCDHRVLYGADGAAFLADVRANLEQPLRLAF